MNATIPEVTGVFTHRRFPMGKKYYILCVLCASAVKKIFLLSGTCKYELGALSSLRSRNLAALDRIKPLGGSDQADQCIIDSAQHRYAIGE